MWRIILALVIALLAGDAIAALGKEGARGGFGRLGASGKGGPITPQPTGIIHQVDGTTSIFQVDAATALCRAGGC